MVIIFLVCDRPTVYSFRIHEGFDSTIHTLKIYLIQFGPVFGINYHFNFIDIYSTKNPSTLYHTAIILKVILYSSYVVLYFVTNLNNIFWYSSMVCVMCFVLGFTLLSSELEIQIKSSAACFIFPLK